MRQLGERQLTMLLSLAPQPSFLGPAPNAPCFPSTTILLLPTLTTTPPVETHGPFGSVWASPLLPPSSRSRSAPRPRPDVRMSSGSQA